MVQPTAGGWSAAIILPGAILNLPVWTCGQDAGNDAGMKAKVRGFDLEKTASRPSPPLGMRGRKKGAVRSLRPFENLPDKESTLV
jgi:hypothetical protein